MAPTENPNGKDRRRDEDHTLGPSLAKSSKSTTAPSEPGRTRRNPTRYAFRQALTKLTSQSRSRTEKAKTRPRNYKKRPRTDDPVLPGKRKPVSKDKNLNKNHDAVVSGKYCTISNKQPLHQSDGLIVGANHTASNPNKEAGSSIATNYAANSNKRQRTSKDDYSDVRTYTAAHNNKNRTRRGEPDVVATCDRLRKFVKPANTCELTTAVHHATNMAVKNNASNSNRLGVDKFSSSLPIVENNMTGEPSTYHNLPTAAKYEDDTNNVEVSNAIARTKYDSLTEAAVVGRLSQDFEIIGSVDNDNADLHNLVRAPGKLTQPTTRKYIFELTKLPPGVQDIDVNDAGAGTESTEWANVLSIHQTLWWQEAEPRYNYLYSSAQGITTHDRRILVDWIVDVHAQYGLQNHTLHLAVSILDRFLAEQDVSSTHRRLVGATAVWIASQYEEGHRNLLAAFVSDGCYTPFEVMHMEMLIANSLNWDIPVPTVLPFLARAIKALRLQDADMIEHFGAYACELALCDASVLTFLPSQIATAAVALGADLFAAVKVEWDTTLVFHTGGYRYTELGPSMGYLWNLVRRDSRGRTHFNAVKRKYSSVIYGQVAVKVNSLKYNGLVGS